MKSNYTVEFSNFYQLNLGKNQEKTNQKNVFNLKAHKVCSVIGYWCSNFMVFKTPKYSHVPLIHIVYFKNRRGRKLWRFIRFATFFFKFKKQYIPTKKFNENHETLLISFHVMCHPLIFSTHLFNFHLTASNNLSIKH